MERAMVAMWRTLRIGPRWRFSALVVAFVLFVGAGITWSAAGAMGDAHGRRLAEVVDQRALAVQQAVAAETRRYTDTIADLAAAVGAQSDLTATDFAAITSRAGRTRLPGATAIAYVVPARTADVAATQERWRAKGSSDLTLSPQGAGPEHLFSVLNRALDNSVAVTGRDLTVAGEPTEALNASRVSGQVTASRTYVLIRDRDLPEDQRQMSFVLTAPVYGGDGTPDTGAFRGWILVGLRGGDFITETLRQAAQKTVAITLTDASVPGTPGVPVASVTDGAVLDEPALRRESTVSVGGRSWRLSVRPTGAIDDGLPTSLPTVVTWFGALVTLLLAALVGTLATARNRALAKVEEATAALRDDIARRELTEARLREREAELEAFAGVAAHDLKAPLTAIAGYTEILTEDHADAFDPTTRRYMERMAAATRRMRTLIDDLLTYATARDATLHLQPVALAELVDDVLAVRSATLDEPPHVEVGPLPTVVADPVLLRQVLDNLIGNAVKYVRPGAGAYVSVTAEPVADGWRVQVTDRGIGIAEPDRDSVFATFHRARGSEGYPGTGLGLAICKRVVDRHHGSIGVAPNPGGGSRFWFTLPGDALSPGTGRTDARPGRGAPVRRPAAGTPP
jgi:signal transduction histidine kinase